MGKKSKRKEKKDKKPKEIGEWNQMERFLLTQDVMGKLKELGVGVYVEQCNELEEIINNYVTKKEESKKIIDLPGLNRNLDINLQLSKLYNPVVCLRNLP